MKANVTLSQMWYNPSLMGFFMRKQAADTLEEFISRAHDKTGKTTDELLNILEDRYEDVDEMEEDMYNHSVEEIADIVGVSVTDAKDNLKDLLSRIGGKVEFDPAVVLDSVINEERVNVFSIDEKGYAETNVGLLDVIFDIEDEYDINRLIDIIKEVIK